ncbi:MAG: alpha/beta hydrolase [Mogibacterium sp.]|nr:alpha/beta hydrolase [Mogibacterium sp.]
MKKTEFTYPSCDGMTTIHGIKWEPEGEPKAVLQIVHGMTEYLDRYDHFASFLTEHGYVVAGEDHLGHGKSVVNDSYHGYFGEGANNLVIQDIHQLRLKLNEEYPSIPYIIMGHSMGSFLTRQYITENQSDYAEGIAGVIIMGTGWQPGIALTLGKGVSSILGAIKGQRANSKLIEIMAFGSYLKRIENPESISDWLTKDREVVKKYRKDPYCRFHFTTNGFYGLFSAIKESQDIKRIESLPNGLPLLFVSGTEDPVGNYGEGVRKAFMKYSEHSYCQVDIKLYEGDRHEILNELDKDEVFADILEWMDCCVEDRK